MMWFVVRSPLSGLIVAVASRVAHRGPGVGVLGVSLPPVSILGMMWLNTTQVIQIA
jgi:hypothetical protein